MKKAFVYFVLLTSPYVATSQTETTNTTPQRNTIYAEAFGQGLLNSFNYDRLYRLDKKVKNSFSAGLTLVPHQENFVLGLPIAYNFIFGEGSNHLELGLGFTVLYSRHRDEVYEKVTDTGNLTHTYSYKGAANDWYSYITPKIGYRFQSPEGGLFLRATFTPMIAGINRLGTYEGSHIYTESTYEYFTHAAFFLQRVAPWVGVSLGYTLKK
ncbi:MAG: hypothetical protein NTX03_02600 [Bacteroidetes bacterium]|nr:hypothetical protein [Bacteroidota bacterium]